MGIGYIGQALVNEVIGRSLIGPRLFGNAAPDAGNAELLLIAATPEQQEQYLRPLAAGEERSCFAMTEPEVAGSDPTGLRTSAVRYQLVLALAREALELAQRSGIPKGASSEAKSGGKPTFLTTS